MSYENNLMMTVFRGSADFRMTVFNQSAEDSSLLINILEFAASVENGLCISLTCKRWYYYLNNHHVTCEGIWHRIAQKVYDPQDFEELERIYPEYSFSAWRRLIRITKGSKLKVYHGKMGKMIQRLFWVCRNGLVDPHQVFYWTEDYVECCLTVQAEKLM